jgi:hypothetical protein
MLRSIAEVVTRVLLLSVAVALLVAVAGSRRREAPFARYALYALLVFDLVYMARGINPTCDVRLLQPAAWVGSVRAHPDSRFYFGGKMAGTIEIGDPDSPKDFTFAAQATSLERRAAFGRQILMYPSGLGAREMLSYDLAVLWPRVFEQAHVRFVKADAEGRDRFLSRAAVRYRVLPVGSGGGRPSTPAGDFVGVAAFDWGADKVRAIVVPEAKVVADQAAQLEAMFSGGWDSSTTALLMAPAGPPDGTPGSPADPAAKIVHDGANRMAVEAGAGPTGGYLVLLDSYSPDWQVRVDGRPGTLYRSNLLFRAVRLAPGRHRVEFVYRPRAVILGAGLSMAGLIAAALVAWRLRGDSK